MTDLAYTGSKRYEDVHGVRRAVYVRTVHTIECQHTRRPWGFLGGIGPARARDILASGIDHWDVNHGHNPAWATWRLCKVCKPTVEDIKELSAS